MSKGKEREIQLALFNRYSSQFAFAAPNYTPREWWECDLWAMLRSGYVIEYEIKLSMSDFHADKNKRMTFFDYEEQEQKTFVKHEMLSERSTRCPNRFMFCVPATISEKVIKAIPDWAGLLVYDFEASYYPHSERITKIKPAPLIHKTKCQDDELRKCMNCLTNRYWPLLERHYQLRKEANQ